MSRSVPPVFLKPADREAYRALYRRQAIIETLAVVLFFAGLSTLASIIAQWQFISYLISN